MAVLAAGLAVLLIVLHLLGILSAVSGFVTSAIYRTAAPVHQIGANLVSGDRIECTDDTVTRLEQLMLENSKLRTLAAENAALKNALEFQEKEQGQVVLARVVAESVDVTNRGLVIDRGTDDGLKSGQPVVVGDGIIIGKVKSVRRQSATVLLLTDSVSKLAVSVQGGTGTSGLLEGDRGLSMMISLIPQSERLSAGDMVVTSGLEYGIRRGLVIGTVDQVHKDSQEPFQTAIVAPLLSAHHPVFVQVITSNEETS